MRLPRKQKVLGSNPSSAFFFPPRLLSQVIAYLLLFIDCIVEKSSSILEFFGWTFAIFISFRNDTKDEQNGLFYAYWITIVTFEQIYNEATSNYPNLNYILHPVCGTLKVALTKSNMGLPNYKIHFEFDDVTLELLPSQYRGLMEVLEWLSRRKKIHKVRCWITGCY